MKARLPINRKTQDRIREEVANEYKKQGEELHRRNFKLICVALNEKFGFGKVRLTRLIDAVEELGKEREDDEVFWYHIDRYLNKMGMDFEKENYEVMDE